MELIFEQLSKTSKTHTNQLDMTAWSWSLSSAVRHIKPMQISWIGQHGKGLYCSIKNNQDWFTGVNLGCFNISNFFLDLEEVRASTPLRQMSPTPLERHRSRSASLTSTPSRSADLTHEPLHHCPNPPSFRWETKRKCDWPWILLFEKYHVCPLSFC